MRSGQQTEARDLCNKKALRQVGRFYWWNFTTPLEPILRKNAKKHKPRRLAGVKRPLRPARKTLCIFFDFPRRDFFRIWKRVFLVVCLP